MTYKTTLSKDLLIINAPVLLEKEQAFVFKVKFPTLGEYKGNFHIGRLLSILQLGDELPLTEYTKDIMVVNNYYELLTGLATLEKESTGINLIEEYTNLTIEPNGIFIDECKLVPEDIDKIKKKDLTFTIELEKTQDILFEMGKQKDKQFLIGFALETNNELENAKGKLERKKLDLIVLNSLNDEGAGFGFKTNKVTFINKNSLIEEKELKSKTEVALDIVNKIINWYDV